MTQAPNIDGVLIQWGDRLFYPATASSRCKPQPRLGDGGMRQRADAIRERIEATVVRRAPQVMVKVTGGGRGMQAIAAHFRYISKNGRLDIEDERGETVRGKDGVHELADDWRYRRQPDRGHEAHRREAFNIMLSMPRGTDPLIVQRAAREFAQTELADHKYVMVLHDHQANPHVHISVRAESKHGKRLNPRKADLHRWRETFAEKLREHGVEAEATRQATRGRSVRHPDAVAREGAGDGRLLKPRSNHRRGAAVSRPAVPRLGTPGREIAAALAQSGDAGGPQGLGRGHRFGMIQQPRPRRANAWTAADAAGWGSSPPASTAPGCSMAELRAVGELRLALRSAGGADVTGPRRRRCRVRPRNSGATMLRRPRSARTPMNAVEIEQAISDLALQPFDAAEFPFAFLAAFGNKDTTLRRLRAGNNNASDVPGGVLQRNNIHIAVCQPGTTGAGLHALRSSPATAKGKAKFILATDGQTLEAEDLSAGETIACDYPDFPDHFGFFLPLAGISTVKEIKDNPIDVRATGRLNKLYVELLRENPDWATAERRGDMNHFMARLIFCFFAEDTDIFNGEALFTRTLEQMSDRDAGNTHEVLVRDLSVR